LDYVVVMLGTNDCKTAFAAASKEIAAGLSLVLTRIHEECGSSGKSGGFPKIILVSPIHLGENIGKPGYDPEFDRTSVQTAKGLASEYRLLAQKTGSLFLNAAEVAKPSPIDQEHLDEEGHRCLADAIAKIITNRENPSCKF
jgi:lysophospholipase L1-like esterase